ncbi:hypothetical protein GLW04_11660 [Halobacillus litoralis]|uniref:Uncharacterized protein n=1 Tax=Halobacillus litoralis TaxID=45668 RepID=A0A845DSF0_9BACI|nr:hypothetical protein [Halobacillus litoralis]MCA1020622.1 hypothetical protein [Halobacillus litoralis]MYL20551.1 hypothetical protein [Halobacillus litoralis]MYL36857.1 hypothetical protein [Halobacillus litoralis]
MDGQPLTIEHFNERFQRWSGADIIITKHELNDEDTTVMHLDHIAYGTDTTRLDEYLPMHSLFLYGEGEAEIGPQQMEPLPAPYYEIPLQDTTQYIYSRDAFVLMTDRATYTIEKR